jgi:beta-lactamase regulating signal transducer with metallopeptidase domain
MNWLPAQAITTAGTIAQLTVERVLNTLPEGLLIAFFAWALLRVLRRQNSGTRFAIWFLALLAIAVLPVIGGFSEGRPSLSAGMSSGAWGSMRPAITIPAAWALVIFLAWAFGACVAMVRLATGLWRLRSLQQSCTAIVVTDFDPTVRKTVEAITTSGTAIATSDCVRVPAAIGFWKRTIVLPTWALQELPAEDLNVILLHESEHLRRADDWTNLIQKIVRSIFFFHPAVWWIESRLSVEREMACDDAVLAQTDNPHGYASCLVSLLEKSLAHRLSHRQWSMVQAAVHRAREASLRLAQILDTNRPAATRVWKPALAMLATFSVICLAVMPHAPQFVAFDRSTLNSNPAYSATSQSSPQSSSQSELATVVPAAWRTSRSLSATIKTASKMPVAKVVHERVDAGRGLARIQAFSGRLNAAPPSEQIVAISTSADQETIPDFRTLVFIETTQYGTANSPVWQVQVWRVTLVNVVRERWVRVPVVNSI